jgi:hypothetical protein
MDSYVFMFLASQVILLSIYYYRAMIVDGEYSEWSDTLQGNDSFLNRLLGFHVLGLTRNYGLFTNDLEFQVINDIGL